MNDQYPSSEEPDPTARQHSIPARTDHGHRYDHRYDHPYVDGPPPPEPAPPAPPVRRAFLKSRTVLVTAVAAVAAVLGGMTGGMITADHTTAAPAPAASTLVSPVSSKSGSGPTIAAVAATVSPSVVEITVRSSAATATGTGVVLTSGGRILTNYHVISGAVDQGGQITVTFQDGSTASATVTGTDRSLDVAVINATGVSGLHPATLGNSDSMAVGDPVVAIGNPEGLTDTVTSGIISAKDRQVSVQVDEGSVAGNGGFGFPDLPGLRGQPSRSSGDTAGYNALQTDAALNPGNSGGPLINSGGQVIGINSAMYSPSNSGATTGSSGSIGLGFAIPINDIQHVLPKLQAGQNI